MKMNPAPAISVILPVYNTEKFIGACLESILNQTFKDFEVVVIDNGSTDNSSAILESYVPKFGRHLKISKIEINPGSPYPARNKAVELARGKYVYLIDSDDLITNDALETLYNYAEKFNADVINMSRWYSFFSEIEKPFPDNENIKIIDLNNAAENPALESENIGKRVEKICAGKFGRTAWQKFVLRDFLLKNNITFLENTSNAADTVWATQVICCAKKILTIPNLLYIYRKVSNSISQTKNSPEKSIPVIMKSMIITLNCIENFLDSQKFFQENPQYRWHLMYYFEILCFKDLVYRTQGINIGYNFFEILKPAFEEFGEYGKVMAYLCTASHFSRVRYEKSVERVVELEKNLKQLQGG